ncbi:Meiotically up-regulated protein [Venturia nashicola]|uniref:Meiotically up-regulated protein n=1 Tax=Venturia nashicola TaxID=86259 RepID=A0A4Z1P759_9PEZI|nr:meiotically up-regulated protein [Venturia nashicola]TLD32157.1 Meiotically up-regulated protein [Venturia nashicola]
MAIGYVVAAVVGCLSLASAQCPDYVDYSNQIDHEPKTTGRYRLPFQRPVAACRTWNNMDLETELTRVKGLITDTDLSRLFENAWPNTLDTAVKWHGTGTSGEELTFLITGDINAMWLRDSANQMQSYISLLKSSPDSKSLASLWRGVINTQARYISVSPYCNSFQPPVESKISPSSSGSKDKVFPNYDPNFVFECKYELDSLAAFLQVSAEYYEKTQDIDFFQKYKWVEAVKAIMKVAKDMQTPTYAVNGAPIASPYTFERSTTQASETLTNNGGGNPIQNGTGLIRSAFRPSDDSTIYQLFIPANMQFASYLSRASEIMGKLPGQTDLATQMQALAKQVQNAISQHGIIQHPVFGRIYAFEVDGFGSSNIMDDANIPSLLSAPLLGYLQRNDQVYQNTRNMILSSQNPYFMRGPLLNAVGSPHTPLGNSWPMASIVRILTSDNLGEIRGELSALVGSTASRGLIHESVSAFKPEAFTRPWFSWANGLFGQMIVDLAQRKPEVLKQSFQ